MPYFPPIRVALSGPDAADFLHRVTTVDVRALSVGSRAPGAILAASGRYEARFLLARDAEDAFTLTTFGGEPWGERLLASLDRLTFAERMEKRVLSSDASAPAGAPTASERIDSLLPLEGHEIGVDVNPLEAGDGAAVAHQKGCYPGQEVIEKIRALGAPAKNLVRVVAPRALTEGTALLDPSSGAEIGRVTTADGTRALAIVRKTHARLGASLRSADGVEGRVDAVAAERGDG